MIKNRTNNHGKINKINKINVIVLGGATASGKTELSLKLAAEADIEIISADSRQIYKHIDIGTAKPSQNERATVKHHFVDLLELTQNYSAGEFGNQAYQTVMEIAEKGKIPVIVGGSGLYIKGLCEGLFDAKNIANLEIRNKLEQKLENFGIESLRNDLKSVDETLYNFYTDKNPRRIMRALEYFYANGEKLSEARKINSSREKIQPHYFVIDINREILYQKINERTEKMWENGLIEETEKILKMGFSETLNSLNTVGYKEAISYLKGEISSEKAIEEIKKNTRHYAKRQITWFKKIPKLVFIKNDISEILKIFKQ